MGKKLLAGAVALLLVLGVLFAPQMCQGPQESAEQVSVGSEAQGGADESGSAEAPDEGAAIEPGTQEPSGESGAPTGALTATFLDVGQGDCCIICCDGETMIVDGGPPNASSRVYSWLKGHGIETIDYLVATHADTDHTGGLSAALEACSCRHAFSSVTTASQDAFNDMRARLERQNVALEVPAVGSCWSLGSARVEVIAGGGAENEGSLVLQVTHGQVRLLLAADTSSEVEASFSPRLSEVNLLKVAHHGSSGSTSYRFLRACMPQNAVISVGRGNSYGHPTEDTLSRLRDCGAKVFRTDMQGDITATSDGEQLAVEAAKNADADTLLELDANSSSSSSAAGGFIGNLNSLKFHKTSCKTLPEEHNRVYFKTRSAAIDAGYTPCGNCRP